VSEKPVLMFIQSLITLRTYSSAMEDKISTNGDVGGSGLHVQFVRLPFSSLVQCLHV
jgi:hypothetical protein